MREYEVFELDHPLTQKDKKERITHAGWTWPEKLHFVPIDFTKDDLHAKLLSADFNPEKKTLFSWLGVSMYLDQDTIEDMLQSIAGLAADGSSLVFDYADAGLFQSDVKRVQDMLAMAKAGGEEMKSGFDPMRLERMLKKYGFWAHDHLNSTEIQSRFFLNREDWLSAFEHINFVHTVIWKKGEYER